MATITTMAMLNPKCLSINSPNHLSPSKPNLPKRQTTTITTPLHSPLSMTKPDTLPPSLSQTAIVGAFFAALGACDPAFATQQIADLAAEGGDNRGLALLLPIVPAILWVLYNILQPALNQLNKMRNEKAIIVGLGLGACGLLSTPSASAVGEIAQIADGSSSDSRGLLLLFVIAPAVLWVLYNILQPALNQINRMRSG